MVSYVSFKPYSKAIHSFLGFYQATVYFPKHIYNSLASSTWVPSLLQLHHFPGAHPVPVLWKHYMGVTSTSLSTALMSPWNPKHTIHLPTCLLHLMQQLSQIQYGAIEIPIFISHICSFFSKYYHHLPIAHAKHSAVFLVPFYLLSILNLSPSPF